MVMLGVSGRRSCRNLLDIYQQAQIKDTQLLESKAKRDQAFEKINESRAAPAAPDQPGRRPELPAKQERHHDQHGRYRPRDPGSIHLPSQQLGQPGDLTEKSATQSDVAYNLEYQNLMLRTPPGLLRRAQGHGYPDSCVPTRPRSSVSLNRLSSASKWA